MLEEIEILGGVVHDLPADMRAMLTANPAALATWSDITPLARNEWICWVTSPKKAETRLKRVDWGPGESGGGASGGRVAGRAAPHRERNGR